MDRKSLLPGGFVYEFRKAAGLPAPEVAPDQAGMKEVSQGRFGSYRLEPITWAEVHQARRERQAERLEQIRMPAAPEWQPVQVWAFFIPGWLFGGWWCYLRTHKRQISGSGPKGNVHEDSRLALELMREIPLGVFPMPENFEAWMVELARQHPRRKTKRDPRKAGLISGWTDGHRFRLTRPPRESRNIGIWL